MKRGRGSDAQIIVILRRRAISAQTAYFSRRVQSGP